MVSGVRAFLDLMDPVTSTTADQFVQSQLRFQDITVAILIYY